MIWNSKKLSKNISNEWEKSMRKDFKKLIKVIYLVIFKFTTVNHWFFLVNTIFVWFILILIFFLLLQQYTGSSYAIETPHVRINTSSFGSNYCCDSNEIPRLSIYVSLSCLSNFFRSVFYQSLCRVAARVSFSPLLFISYTLHK